VELNAIAAVVIGGTLLTGGAGTLQGTLCGVLLLDVIQNCINLVGNLDSSYQSVVSGVFLVGVVIVQTLLPAASGCRPRPGYSPVSPITRPSMVCFWTMGWSWSTTGQTMWSRTTCGSEAR